MSEKQNYTRARVRICKDVSSQSIDPPLTRHFHVGEEMIMIQFTPDVWWDSTDIDGAHIIPASAVHVIEVLSD